MTEEVTMQPEEDATKEAQQATQEQAKIEEEIVVVGDVIAVDPYASQAHLADENRMWPPPLVKNHG